MRRYLGFASLLLAGSAALTLSARPAAAEGELTVVSWGGAYQMSQQEAYIKPFSKETGVKITEEEYNGEIAKIRAMVESNSVTWDVIDVDTQTALAGCAVAPPRGDPEPRVGLASWYGPRHHGRVTASGQPFDMHQLVAAHRTLPFGTPVRVVALDSGRTVVPPSPGTAWRINFSRVQWDLDVTDGRYVKRTRADGTPAPEHNWVWSAQGEVNMHVPERWGRVTFLPRATEGAP